MVQQYRRGERRIAPAKLISFGFALVIFIGSVLLSLPVAVAGGGYNRYIDALFTATSAVCVTGLVVVDTGTFYSLFGQGVIISLIQIGGLGIITVASIYAFLFRRRIGLKERLVMKEALNMESLGGIVRLVKSVLLTTFVLEGIGAVLLTLTLTDYFNLGKSIYYGFFHAVSAFCNAGFDVFGPEFYPYCSVIPFQNDWRVLCIIALMITLGGLGYPVLFDIRKEKNFRCLSLHSKLVLVTSAVLVLGGTLIFLLIEHFGVMSRMGPVEAVVNSLFLSITPRTAGYTSVDIAKLAPSSILILMFLMFVGASPVSTGGGIKTVTFAVLVMAVYSRIKGKTETEAFRRRIESTSLYQALTVTMLAGGLVALAIIVLTLSSHFDTIRLMFEAFSAFGTVGLSTGITPDLNTASKVVLIILMFAGRVGPLTVAFALLEREGKDQVKYPRGNVIIG